MGIFDVFQNGPPDSPPKAPSPKHTILVVDDEQDLRDIYQEFLTQEGFCVYTAKNGIDGLNLAIKYKPHLILLDLMMPSMDGNEVLGHLWENPQTKEIPVIVLTNAGNLTNMEQAKYFSTRRFLIKANVSLEEVSKEIKNILREAAPSPIILYTHDPTLLDNHST
jgi:DNA-binding response OmpR family regulator